MTTTNSFADRVSETTSTTGTGTLTLNGAVTGFQSFSSAFTTGTIIYYTITDGTAWEVGSGTFTSPSTLSRDVVIASSNAGALVNFTSSTMSVFNTYPSSQLISPSNIATLTNKFVTARSSSTSSASSITPDANSFDEYIFTALAAALTINNPTGSPTDGQCILYKILDNGTARALAFGTNFAGCGAALPTTTTISKTSLIMTIYDSLAGKWLVLPTQVAQ